MSELVDRIVFLIRNLIQAESVLEEMRNGNFSCSDEEAAFWGNRPAEMYALMEKAVSETMSKPNVDEAKP